MLGFQRCRVCAASVLRLCCVCHTDPLCCSDKSLNFGLEPQEVSWNLKATPSRFSTRLLTTQTHHFLFSWAHTDRGHRRVKYRCVPTRSAPDDVIQSFQKSRFSLVLIPRHWCRLCVERSQSGTITVFHSPATRTGTDGEHATERTLSPNHRAPLGGEERKRVREEGGAQKWGMETKRWSWLRAELTVRSGV